MTVLSGCSNQNPEMDRCMELRERLLTTGCTFQGTVTADFGDSVYGFTLACSVNAEGSLSFTVAAPEEISGISGTIHGGQGKLEYEDVILAFPLLADGQLSPVSVPWLLIHSLRSGNMVSSGKDGDGYLLNVRDSFQDDALELDVRLDKNGIPVKADILWQGRRAVSIEVEDFRFV